MTGVQTCALPIFGLEFLVWCALSVLAGVLSVAGSPREGARCLGGAQANVERFDPADYREQSRDREALIRQLGVEDYDREYADGAGLSIKEAREFALGHLRNLIRNPGPVDEPEFE